MPRPRIVMALLAALIALPVLALPATPAAAAVPAGFTDTLVARVPSPTAIAFTPDGRMLVASQTGQLRVLRDGRLLARPALNLAPRICSQGERGLAGVAVDPAFRANRRIYLYWTHASALGCRVKNLRGPDNRVTRHVLRADSTVDPASETVLAANILSYNVSHNGGDLHFGADGLLYVSTGDAGCQLGTTDRCAELNGNSRRLDLPLGKILRIRTDGSVPAGNPYAGRPGARHCTRPSGVPAGTGPCAETFASGLRNPFRFAVRPGSNEIFVNDVGQGTWEEVNRLRAGADYGWNVREGFCPVGATTGCGPSRFAEPLYAYSSAGRCSSITGAAFVPAGVWPARYAGAYLFADFVCGSIFSLRTRAGGGVTRTVFASGLPTGLTDLTFGRSGGSAALFYATYDGGGQVRRIAD